MSDKYDDAKVHARLFSGDKADYAFHTDKEKNPWAKVDLGAVKTVNAVVIENRASDRRAEGLIVSVPEDEIMSGWAASAPSSCGPVVSKPMRTGTPTDPIAPASSAPEATISKELEEPAGRVVGMVIEPLTAPLASAVRVPSGTVPADDTARADLGDVERAAKGVVHRAESWIVAERAKCEPVTVS